MRGAGEDAHALAGRDQLEGHNGDAAGETKQDEVFHWEVPFWVVSHFRL
jgi:hypothetical protein